MLQTIFEYILAVLSLVQKWLHQLNARKYDINEHLKQNDDNIISKKMEKY